MIIFDIFAENRTSFGTFLYMALFAPRQAAGDIVAAQFYLLFIVHLLYLLKLFCICMATKRKRFYMYIPVMNY